MFQESSFTEKTIQVHVRKPKLIAQGMPISTTHCDFENPSKRQASEPSHRLLKYYWSIINTIFATFHAHEQFLCRRALIHQYVVLAGNSNFLMYRVPNNLRAFAIEV